MNIPPINSELFESHPWLLRMSGHDELEMFDEVEEDLRRLPGNVADHRALHPLRMRLAAGQGDFSKGAAFAVKHMPQCRRDREAAGKYLLAMARHAHSRGLLDFGLALLQAHRLMVPEWGLHPRRGNGLESGRAGCSSEDFSEADFHAVKLAVVEAVEALAAEVKAAEAEARAAQHLAAAAAAYLLGEDDETQRQLDLAAACGASPYSLS